MSTRGRTRGAPAAFVLGASFGSLFVTVVWFAIGGRSLFLEGLSSSNSDLAHYRMVRNFVMERYVDEPDPDELVRVALSGMVESLDEYSRYYHTKSEIDVYKRNTHGSFAGIGVIFLNKPGTGQIQVLFPFAGSAAERAGVRVGDRIVSVDGTSLEGLTTQEAVAMIVGEEGDDVALGVLGLDDGARELVITRETRPDPSVRHAHLIDAERKVGYLALTSFTLETGEEFKQSMAALVELEMNGLVLDLRGNPGGVLKTAISLASHFVSDGVIAQTRGRGEPTIYERSQSDGIVALDIPLVVLVDGGSASSSEVLAGALQDHRVAVLVGSPTYGKARVQSVRQFEEQGALVKLTSSYYQTPSGRDLDRTSERPWGLRPDVVVEMDNRAAANIHRYINRYDPPKGALTAIMAWQESTEEELLPVAPSDPQLDAALSLLRGDHPDVR